MPNGNSTIKCNSCSRQFKSAAALRQHRMANHSGAAKAQSKKGTRQVRGNRSTVPRRMAPVATTMSIVGKNSNTAGLSGTDRFATIADISKLPAGSLAIDMMFDPGDVPRLRTVCRAFQHIRYKYLRFKIEPQISTATSGGYVAGFIPDPADVPPGGSELLEYITASQGSVTTKWWQQSTISTRVENRDYFTSEGAEVREFSPGRFLMAVDGKATQSGNLTVFVEWSVSLHTPSFEAEKQVAVPRTVLRNLYTKNDDVALWGKSDDGKYFDYSIDQLITGAAKGVVYRLRTPVYVQEATDSALRACWYLNCTSSSRIQLAREGPEDTFDKPASDVLLLLAGTELDLYTPPKVFLKQALSSPCPETIGPGSMKETLSDLSSSIKLLSDLTRSLANSMSLIQSFSQNRETCSLREFSKPPQEFPSDSPELRITPPQSPFEEI